MAADLVAQQIQINNIRTCEDDEVGEISIFYC